MVTIRIHHETGALVVWRGDKPSDLADMRQEVERNFARTPLPPGVTRQALSAASCNRVFRPTKKGP
jgi:hypothetical protein